MNTVGSVLCFNTYFNPAELSSYLCIDIPFPAEQYLCMYTYRRPLPVGNWELTARTRSVTEAVLPFPSRPEVLKSSLAFSSAACIASAHTHAATPHPSASGRAAQGEI